MALSERLFRFVENLQKHPPMTPEEAYVRAGYSANGAMQAAWRAMQRDDVKAEIASRQQARARETEYGVKEVLRDWTTIANADPTELVEHRLGACRHCWGLNFQPMYTPSEMDRMRSSHAQSEKDRNAQSLKRNEEFEPTEFDERGGVGFNPNRGPNPECPECHGDGTTRPIFKDTRNLSSSAKMLYIGLKVTKNGMELLLADQARARDNIAKHLGMFVDRLQIVRPIGDVEFAKKTLTSLYSILDEITSNDSLEEVLASKKTVLEIHWLKIAEVISAGVQSNEAMDVDGREVE